MSHTIPTAENARSERRTAIASLVGTAIEYYDFALYGAAAAVVFGTVFFPSSNSTAGVLASFATYAVGFAARPLGGLALGALGDRFGRKPVLITTLLLMGLATFGIGLIPSHESIGVWAPVLLITLRIIQGFGAGAEYAGAVVLSTETARSSRRGLLGSFPAVGNFVGALVALLIFRAIAQLDDDVLYEWGWRVPFLLALPLLAISLWIRTRVEESPEFVEARGARADSSPRAASLRLILSRYKWRLLLGLGINCWAGNSYVIQVFAISYMLNDLGLSASLALTVTASAYVVGIITIPLYGALVDRLGAGRLFIGASVAAVVYVVPFWLLLDTADPWIAAFAVIAGLSVITAAQFASQPTLYRNLFPTEARYSGMAISREFTGAAIGGTAPLVATALVAGAGDWHVLAALMSLCAVVTLAAGIGVVAATSPSRRRPMPEAHVGREPSNR